MGRILADGVMIVHEINDDHKYDDIINLPHHTSPKRPRMPMIDRAAQFSPFAALTGYDAAVKETARLTDERIEIDESSKMELDEKLRMVQESLNELPEITITFFEPDEKKSGGSYISVTGCVKKIDNYERCVIMQDKQKIPIDEIIQIEGEIFRFIENMTI